MPTLFILLILNYLDRNALASARVQGYVVSVISNLRFLIPSSILFVSRSCADLFLFCSIEADLGMEGNQFNSAISLLFVGYILG